MKLELVQIAYLRHVDDEDGGPPVADKRGQYTFLAMGEGGQTLSLPLNAN